MGSPLPVSDNYSSYLGGAGVEQAFAVATDQAGNVYAAGYTASSDFPVTAGALQTSLRGYDGFVTKFDPSGSQLMFSTFIGGNQSIPGGTDGVTAIVVDQNGSAFVAGWTSAQDFPVTGGAFDTTHNGGGDIFVSKLDPSGSRLEYSTYIGGSDFETAYSLAIAPNGDLLVAGWTYSTDFPLTPGAIDSACTSSSGQCRDAFLLRLDWNGSALVFSTYLGGTQVEYGLSVALGPGGDIFAMGTTASADFPTTIGALQPANAGGTDAWVARLDGFGTRLVYSTYLGGSNEEFPHSHFVELAGAIAIDRSGVAYVTGVTFSSDFPMTQTSFDNSANGDRDVFLTAIVPNGTSLVFSPYLGGRSYEYGIGIALDSNGSALVVGRSASADFPLTVGSGGRTCGQPGNLFFARFTEDGRGLWYSACAGGGGDEAARSVSLAPGGRAWVAGWTSSSDFPVTAGAYDLSFNGGGYDSFLLMLLPGEGGLPWPPVDRRIT